jgi:hypothetical protein
MNLGLNEIFSLLTDSVINVEAGDEKAILAWFEEGLRHGVWALWWAEAPASVLPNPIQCFGGVGANSKR